MMEMCSLFLFVLIFAAGKALKPCPALPHVSNSTNNATGAPPFPSGTSVQFTCNEGFKRVNTLNALKCVDGKWDGYFTCVQIECKSITPPVNGRFRSGTSHAVGSVVEIDCNAGYQLIGSATFRCMDNGQWRPSELPICEIVTCGDIRKIPHASLTYVDGKTSYGSTVNVTCDDGYIKSGWWNPKCQADGTWDETPVCEPSPCGSHPALKSSCILDTRLQNDGLFLAIACQDDSADVSVTETGRGVAYCTGEDWNNPSMGCFCDCKLTVDDSRVIANNLNDAKFLKHNTQLDWECHHGYKKKTDSIIECLDGKFNKTPECELANVFRPSETESKSESVSTTIICILVIILVLLVLICGALVYLFWKKKKA